MANTKRKPTTELLLVFKYIIDNLLKEYPSDKVTSPYFIIAFLEADNNIANKILSKFLMNNQIQYINEQCFKYLSINSISLCENVNEDIITNSDIIQGVINETDKQIQLNSGMLLKYLIENDDFVSQLFKSFGTMVKHIKSAVDNENTELTNNAPKKHEKKNKEENDLKKTNSLWKNKKTETNEVERLLVNINKLASSGKIDEYIGGEEKIDSILRILLKKKNNNAIIVGDEGAGKTTLIKHISNMIVNGTIPKPFLNKVLMEVKFDSLLSGMIYKGSFETRIKMIIEDAKKQGCYILFIDDIDSLLENSRYGENDANILLDSLVNEDKIQLILTCSSSGYSKFCSNNKNLSKKIHKIDIDAPSEELTYDILNSIKEKYELFHNVKFTEEALKNCIRLCKHYFNDYSLPQIVTEIIDEIGADVALKTEDSNEIKTLNESIDKVLKEKEELNKSTVKEYDKIDELTKKEIKLKSLLSLAQKTDEINKTPKIIEASDIDAFMSKKINIPLSQVKQEERDKLKNINNILKAIVIGQDEAVDDVCQVIKRQRMGLSNPNKPSVLMFTGTTGTGKTYLAKKVAEKIFGNEKYLVRLDMSEYSDKMAASKLIGSSAGYIGYENGGILTEAIKKNKYCVLLLDECEKADESVFNMFLQVFDEGRLTDNKGTTVDFKNVIIIMTSNVGAQEVSERQGGIGFKHSETDINTFNKGIYDRAIKRQFKPEFINRIDKIVFFKTLCGEDLKKIVRMEIEKVDKKLTDIGYSLHNDVYEPIIEKIINNITDKTEYGARPILREIQRVLEDKIVDLLINSNIKKGHKFKYKELI